MIKVAGSGKLTTEIWPVHQSFFGADLSQEVLVTL